MSTEPKRLIELDSEAPDSLRALLRDAQGVGPSSAQVARLADKLGPLFGAAAVTGASGLGSGGAAASGAGGTAAASASASGGAKLALVAAVAAGIGGGALWLASSERAAPTALESAPIAIPAPSAASPEVATPPATAEPEPSTSAELAPAESAKPDVPERREAPPAQRLSEAELLERARGALKSDPARALSLTREHAARFPKGILTQEREIIAIEALSRLKRDAEAAGRAEQFKKQYPDSAHQRKLDSLNK